MPFKDGEGGNATWHLVSQSQRNGGQQAHDGSAYAQRKQQLRAPTCVLGVWRSIVVDTPQRLNSFAQVLHRT